MEITTIIKTESKSPALISAFNIRTLKTITDNSLIRGSNLCMIEFPETYWPQLYILFVPRNRRIICAFHDHFLPHPALMDFMTHADFVTGSISQDMLHQWSGYLSEYLRLFVLTAMPGLWQREYPVSGPSSVQLYRILPLVIR